jgi:phage terminase large subunit-like protein
MLIRHPSDEEKVKLGHVWNEEAGQRVITFIEKYLVLEDGRPFTLLPWMRDAVRSWYCWLKPDGTRSTKVGLLTCGRKNAKSCLTYGLTAYHLIADGEQSPSCVSCAVNREQAAQIFDWFRFAIDHNPTLSNALHAVASKKTIFYPKRNGRYRSLASDAGGNFGHGHTFVIHDELAFHKRDDVYTALKNSTDAKANGLQIITSTAGWNKNGAFYKLVQYGRKVLSGEVIDPTFQPFIFEAKTDDYDDPANWHAANPSLGVVQSVDDFRANWNRDKQEGTSRLSAIRLKMNRWTDAENSWIGVDEWDACKGHVPNLDGQAVVLGVDVGASRDLTGISLVAPDGNKMFVKSWGFVPEGAMKTRENANAHIYQTCQQDGSLTITEGTATDENFIIKYLDDLCRRYQVKAVVFDKWQSLVISNYLAKKGVTVFNFPQTHSYFNAPCLELEKLVGQRRIVHDGNHLLRWQIGHTYLNRDGKGYVKPTTSRPENKKDNLIALLMAVSQCLAGNVETKKSVYEGRGVILF